MRRSGRASPYSAKFCRHRSRPSPAVPSARRRALAAPPVPKCVQLFARMNIRNRFYRCSSFMCPVSGWGFALLRESLSFACPNESNQRKRHPVLRRCFASMPCAAPAESGRPETRRAARDSDIRPSFSLSASTARRCAQGVEGKASTVSGKVGCRVVDSIEALRPSGFCMDSRNPLICYYDCVFRQPRDGRPFQWRVE